MSERSTEDAPEGGFNIRGIPWVVTERQMKLEWGGGGPAEYFRCAWCGHRFKPGDIARCIYTNGGVGIVDGVATPEPHDLTAGIGGNPFCCDHCYGPRPELLARLRTMRAEIDTKYWWFAR